MLQLVAMELTNALHEKNVAAEVYVGAAGALVDKKPFRLLRVRIFGLAWKISRFVKKKFEELYYQNILLHLIFIVLVVSDPIVVRYILRESAFSYDKMDPYLSLDEDMRLQVICTKHGEDNCYGSQKDEDEAMKALSAIKLNDQQLKDTLLSHLV
ncbi:hypothetical protein L1887_03271 [Cichorium endivia]|nr:hypothetical protein L1887_03271 [Cichorium endivia]